MDWDALASGIPVSFGKQIKKKESKISERIEQTKRIDEEFSNLNYNNSIIDLRFPNSSSDTSNSNLPIASSSTANILNDRREEEVELEELNNNNNDLIDTRDGYDLPVSHEVIMKDHSKVSFLLLLTL